MDPPDPSEAGRRALGLHRAIAAAVARAAVQDHPLTIDAVRSSSQDLPRRAAVLISLGAVDEIRLAEAPLRRMALTLAFSAAAARVSG